VRILRLTNSNDELAAIPENLRASAITDRIVSEAVGEPVETVVRLFWPGPELPAILERWLARYEPDVVLIRCASFWVCYESVPLKLQRNFGRAGAGLSRIGFSVGGNRTIASNPAARAIRRWAVRTIGGATYFTPESATESVAAILRPVLAREATIPVVRGPGHTLNAAGTRAGLERSSARNADFDRRLADLCARLHVAYAPVREAVSAPGLLLGDDVHSSIAGTRIFGELEGRAIVEAWRAANAAAAPAH
jgi:hypothetical protein